MRARASVWRAFAAACLGAASASCTLIGASVGAGADALARGPYEIRAPLDRKPLRRGDGIAVATRTGAWIYGTYRGRRPPTRGDPEAYLVLEQNSGLVYVAQSDVTRVALEIDGKGWLYGGLAGLAVDTLIVVGVIIAAHSIRYNDYDWGRSGGFLR